MDHSSDEETVSEGRGTAIDESLKAPSFLRTDGTFESIGTYDSAGTSDSRDHIVVSPIHEGSDDEETGVEVTANFMKEVVQEGKVGRSIYIAAFAVIGAVLRMYTERLFGLDCELGEDAVDDFLTPLSRHICITSSGQTDRRGGSVFSVLPANMLGSFVMGILSPTVSSGHPIPWFRKNHPIQKHLAFHDGLKLGFCGCLTTFASWNTQMIIMLDGTQTELGSQVGAALFGYILGMVCPAICFMVGRHVHEWLRTSHSGETEDDGDGNETEYSEEPRKTQDDRDGPGKSIWAGLCSVFGINFGPFLLVAALFTIFVIQDTVQDIPYYRKLWIACLVSPCGALLRWKLSKRSYPALSAHLSWLPWGTFLANVVAAVVAIALAAVTFRYLDEGDAWLVPISGALSAGFAGSLSTVSTMMRELFDRDTPMHSHWYWFATLTCSMILGLAFYSPIVRS